MYAPSPICPTIVLLAAGVYGIRAHSQYPEPRLTPAASIPTSESPADDYALMRRIAAGDTAALKTLYDRHSTIVYTLALRMLRQPQDAEQLLTDIFFEIWDARARYDETRANPITYLMRLTRSRAIDRLRRKGPPDSRGISLDPAAGIDVAIEDAPLAAAQADENRTRIARALAALDPDQRQIIQCAYYQGLSHSQIASQLKKPLGTVKSSIRIGLARLRDILRPEE